MQPSAKIVGPALYEELDRNVPAMLQGHVPDIAGELAYRLCAQAGGRMSKVFFCSSGSEGVEATFKVCPRPHQAPGHSLCRWRISRPYLRCAIADGQSVLDCGIWSIAARHEVRSLRRCRATTFATVFEEIRGVYSRTDSGRGRSSAPARKIIWRRRRRCAGTMAPCLSWTKSRPACIEPGRFLRLSITASSPT